MKNKCEELGLKHAWKENTERLNLCPSPMKKDICLNCGLEKYYRREVNEWIEYSDGLERPGENTTITVPM